MKKIIALTLLLPFSAAAQPAISELKGSAGPDVKLVVPAAQAVSAAVAPAHGSLIVTGEVVAVKDDPNNPRFPVSEHSPNWKIATIKVARTLKGAPVQTVDVWFPGSMDIMWAASPKFKVGDTGTWILSDVAAASGHLTALQPSDFHAAPGQPQNTSPAVSPVSSYRACGCGCCGGVQPHRQCLYHAKGDDLADIIAKDQAMRGSAHCATLGCSMGVEYSYCDGQGGQPQAAATEQELIRFKDRISASLMGLDNVVGVGIGGDANGKPMLLIYFLTNKTSAARVRQEALGILPADAASQLQAYEAAGQLKFAPTARVEG